jgi:diguanylate cyclase (GGDEF)-like protein/PAS domain S-box-containing protein
VSANADHDLPSRRQQAILAALETINDLVFIYDEHLRIVYANQALLDLWGIEFEDVHGRTLRELVADHELSDLLEAELKTVLETGETYRSTTRYVSPTGQQGFFEYIFRRYRHDNGAWVVGSTRDISERAKLTEELQKANNQLNTILESITDAFYALDSNHRITYVNRHASELLRRDGEEILGCVVWDEFPEAANTELWAVYHQAFEDLVPRTIEFYYEPLEIWFEVHVHPSPGLLSVFFRDITDKYETQKRLIANERRYRTLTNAMPQMVWLTDANGYHLYYNDRWYEFTGLTVDESLGFGFSNALHPGDKERTLEEWQRAWRNGEHYEIEYRFYSRSLKQYRWFLGRAYPVRNEEGEVIEWVGTCTDIDLQKRTEARMKESELRLAEAQRIARIGNWDLDLNTGEFSCSEEHTRIFGFKDPSDTKVIEASVQAIHPDDRQLVQDQRDRVLEQGHGNYDVQYRIIRADGETRIIHTLAEVMLDDAGQPARLVGTVHDITERYEIEKSLEEYARQQSVMSRQLQQLNATLEQQVEDRTAELRRLSQNLEQMVWERTAELEESRAALAHQAQHDALTRLPNRLFFEERLERALAIAERNGTLVAVLFLDLDGFKLVNDTFGHAQGDDLLKATATRLLARLRRYDTLARHGGDEFVAILEGLTDPDDALTVAQDLIAAVSEPFTVQERTIRLSASVGVAFYPQDADTVFGLQRHADVAMYRAKMSGKNDVRFYSPSMNAAAEERLEIASRLSAALDSDELQVYFQPQVTAFSGRIEQFEALLRWFNPTLGSVSPARLIPIAEEVGLMTEIGNWVLDQSCQQVAIWTELTGQRLRVSVNVSASQIDRDDFVDTVSAALDRHRLVPSQLELELTESAVATDIERMIDRMTRLRDIGVRVAMDDFGLGSSSLSNLVRLPLDTVKIDRAFIRDLAQDNAADRVVQAIVALTGGIGLDVVAEGVETEAQRQRVIELGCERLQGFLVGYPANAEATFARVREANGPK